ncbi:ROK family protein [Gryllotalpicola ginsengisoli]|uniref:ROK family protein n=1 Tax=Gryllotalpicola ginsengisoli TaxID=444608 RepID=UPI0003B34180|nr:ROK family protein [Gryllotalpicola ginsengisoli]
MPESVVLAVDFGGTKVEAALVNGAGVLIPGSRSRLATGREAEVAALEASVRGVVRHALDMLRARGDLELAGVGIGCAGPVDRTAGTISPLNVPSWRGYPMRELIGDAVARAGFDVPVALEMDGVAIVLAEHWVGAAQGVDNVMGMVVSTGVGGGIIAHGRVITGRTGNAGHIGHVEVAGIVGEDTFGNREVLEAIASGPHTVAYARRHGFAGATGEELAAAYREGDPVAVDAMKRTGRAVGKAIASAAALLDLDVVAIGGGFSQATPDLFDFIREQVAAHHFEFVRKVKVVPSGLSGEGPLIGAAALIFRSELLPPR